MTDLSERRQTRDDDIIIEKNENGTEIYIFDPYNSLNKLINNNDIQQILKMYGIDVPIFNYEIYKRAFIHRSYLKRPNIENDNNNIIIVPKPENCLSLYTKSNERLEFIGDGVLECITKYYLYRRFPKENEGFMTEKKIALIKNEAIGRLALEIGLNKWFILSKHAETKQIRYNLKKLGCLFEAFIGAIFLDFNKIAINDEDGWFRNVFISGPGYQMVQIFIENIYEKHIDWINLIKTDDNYKNILQVKIQKEFKITPEYLEIEEYNIDIGYYMGVYLCVGQPIIVCSHYNSIRYSNFKNFQEIHEYISVNNGKILLFLGEGKNKTKKKAEQIASEEAIKHLELYL
jgi:dsRNA-specific ribonuclease